MGNWSSTKLISRGKVRLVYENGDHDRVILVATDVVSAFDEQLGVTIPGKGKMLTRISKYWFEKTATMVPNAYMAAKLDFSADYRYESEAEGDKLAITEMFKLNMLPVECIVRGYITGSMWEAYNGPNKIREFCGITLPHGLRNSEQLPEPIFTPTTKAPAGEHDQNLSFEEMIVYLEKNHFVEAREKAETIRDYSIRLYKFAYGKLLRKGIILADTKFEFGLDPVAGRVMLGDELLTPDSSRFWPLTGYKIGKNQKSLDKQVIRDWVKAHPNEKVPDEILEEARQAYGEITQIITIDREEAAEDEAATDEK